MAKTAAQLMAEANKLIEQAKELERQECQKIGQHVKRLHKEGKLLDKHLSDYLNKLLGMDEEPQESTKSQEHRNIDSASIPDEPKRDITKNASY